MGRREASPGMCWHQPPSVPELGVSTPRNPPSAWDSGLRFSWNWDPLQGMGNSNNKWQATRLPLPWHFLCSEQDSEYLTEIGSFNPHNACWISVLPMRKPMYTGGHLPRNSQLVRGGVRSVAMSVFLTTTWPPVSWAKAPWGGRKISGKPWK